MPSVSDCPVCEPDSPFADEKPWRLWQHRRFSEIFTSRGRRAWKDRREAIKTWHSAHGARY